MYIINITRYVFLILFIFSVIPVYSSNIKKELYTYLNEDNININNVIKNVNAYIKIRKENINIKSEYNNVDSQFRYHYKLMVYSVAFIESSFIHKRGLISKDDVSYLQINLRWWPIHELNLLTNTDFSVEKLMNDYKLATYVALHIMLYNSYIMNKTLKKKLSRYEIIASYHNPYTLNNGYSLKARNAIQKFYPLFK